MRALLTVDPAMWRKEVTDFRAYLEKYGNRLPAEMVQELDETEKRLAG